MKRLIRAAITRAMLIVPLVPVVLEDAGWKVELEPRQHLAARADEVEHRIAGKAC